jgi:1,4-alpha-glucan branching enzyme
MSEPIGTLCIVLHAHLPYVLHHGERPHGEAWLYEAAAESYLPILDLIGETALHRARPALTIGLTPVLLEQLAHERFKNGLVTYLKERGQQAGRDRHGFEHKGETHFAALAARWEKWCDNRLAHFERINRDIPGEFAARAAEGHIQLIGGPATHPYLPLLLNDTMLRAQLACGRATSSRHLGTAGDGGMWLPECAYRAAANWEPPVLGLPPRERPGLESLIAGAGFTHFFVDAPSVAKAEPLGKMRGNEFHPVGEAELHWDRERGWGSPLEPVGVASRPEPARCAAMARHPQVCEQVWSGQIGYPGSREYLEFHRKHPESGFRYHRVTDVSSGLGDKDPYVPEDIFSKLYEQVQHFCRLLRQTLADHRAQTGRPGVCVAAFDAELFGHWWFEGPQFLRDVIFTLSHDRAVKLATSSEALRDGPPDKVVRLAEGSWGEGGGHDVWLNDRTRWMWEVEYRAEQTFLRLLRDLPWRRDASVAEMLRRSARELLLLQASDWPFAFHAGSAIDYAVARFSGHATRFQRACAIARQLAAGGALGTLESVQVQEMDAHDSIFRQIDLQWWE